MPAFAATYHTASAPQFETPADVPAFVVRRKGTVSSFRKVFARRETLGEVAAIINRCHEASPSEWTVDGVRVPGSATTSEIHAALVKAGKIEA